MTSEGSFPLKCDVVESVERSGVTPPLTPPSRLELSREIEMTKRKRSVWRGIISLFHHPGQNNTVGSPTPRRSDLRTARTRGEGRVGTRNGKWKNRSFVIYHKWTRRRSAQNEDSFFFFICYPDLKHSFCGLRRIDTNIGTGQIRIRIEFRVDFPALRNIERGSIADWNSSSLNLPELTFAPSYF